MPPLYEPVIDQHDTWLVVNPVQGCPKDCSYCYLKDLGLTLAKPTELACRHPHPAPRQPVLPPLPRAGPVHLHRCPRHPRTRAHLIALLDILGDSVRNPVCLITKCKVTDEVIAAISRNQAKGLRVIVYLSTEDPRPHRSRRHQHGREGSHRLAQQRAGPRQTSAHAALGLERRPGPCRRPDH